MYVLRNLHCLCEVVVVDCTYLMHNDTYFMPVNHLPHLVHSIIGDIVKAGSSVMVSCRGGLVGKNGTLTHTTTPQSVQMIVVIMVV